ncbi:hypothetical protein [Thermococcus sp.]
MKRWSILLLVLILLGVFVLPLRSAGSIANQISMVGVYEDGYKWVPYSVIDEGGLVPALEKAIT